MIYFTSDLHFGHDKAFLYAPRGFQTIEEHDETIIQKWNSIVQPTDEVYILGDLMLNDNEHGVNCGRRLNGRKLVILGNHDTDARVELYKEFAEVLGYATIIKDGKFRAYLSHYPTMMGNFEENFGPVCLHGHTHSANPFQYANNRCYNVALDAHNCYPVSIEQIRSDIRKFRGME